MREHAVIQILLWAPLAAGLLACAMPQRLVAVPPLLTAVIQRSAW